MLWSQCQERSLPSDKFGYITYLCYLLYAPLYIAGPIVSFNAFASQVCDQVIHIFWCMSCYTYMLLLDCFLYTYCSVSQGMFSNCIEALFPRAGIELASWAVWVLTSATYVSVLVHWLWNELAFVFFSFFSLFSAITKLLFLI